MSKLTKLTKEQELRFPEFVKKWTDIGLCTKRANRKLAEQHCHEAYKIVGLEDPKLILWAESPIGLLLAAKLIKEIAKKGYKPYSEMNLNIVGDSVWNGVGDSVRDSVWNSVGAIVGTSVGTSVGDSVRDSVGTSVGDSVWTSVVASVGASVRASVRDSVGDSVRDSVRASVWASELKQEWIECNSWGQHDAGWLSFYDYFNVVCSLKKETDKLQPLINLSKETGWHLFYKNVAILSEKPIEIYRNERGQLHNFNGPAIKWNDGYELYRFNGIRLDGDLSKYAKKDSFTKEEILKETNADIRRELVKKIGIVKAVELLGAKVIDTETFEVGGKYELLEIDYDGRGKRPYLRMQNPSLQNTHHIEGIKPGVRTVREALAYRMGLQSFIQPKALT